MTTKLISSGDPAWLNAEDIDFDLPYGRQIKEVVEAYQGIGYVAGGAARYLLVPDAPGPGDIDVFLFGDRHDWKPLTEIGYDWHGGVERAPLFSRDSSDLRVQVVKPDPDNPQRTGYGPPLQVLQAFTFHTEQAAIWRGEGGFSGLMSSDGLYATQNKVLTNNVISNPILSMFRINKYGRKGFSIGMKDVMEIAEAINALGSQEFEDVTMDALSMVS